MSSNDTKRLTVEQDRRLIRNRWHSHRFVVAHVTAPEADPEDVTDRVQRNAERANTRDSLRRDPALKVPSETGISIG